MDRPQTESHHTDSDGRAELSDRRTRRQTGRRQTAVGAQTPQHGRHHTVYALRVTRADAAEQLRGQHGQNIADAGHCVEGHTRAVERLRLSQFGHQSGHLRLQKSRNQDGDTEVTKTNLIQATRCSPKSCLAQLVSRPGVVSVACRFVQLILPL